MGAATAAQGAAAGTAVQAITAGSNVTVSRAGNNVTINAAGGGGGGTVTSVNVDAASGSNLTASGGPVTTSGSITIGFDSGYSALSSAQAALIASAVQPAALSEYVPTSRTIDAGTGLAGGGALSANRTIALSSASIASLALADAAVQPSRTITAGAGLTGGGDLSANRTLALSSAAQASLAAADTAIQQIIAGGNVVVDNTDPLRPVISATGSGGGGGTVLSVGLSAPTGFSVGGAPVTTTGTLALTYAPGYEGFTAELKSAINSAVQPDDLGGVASIDLPSAPAGDVLSDNGTWVPLPSLGSGDVVGPNGGVVDGEIMVSNGTTGKSLKGAGKGIADLATAAQGVKADTALQPAALDDYTPTSGLADVATSGDYGDLENPPSIPSTPAEIGAEPAGKLVGINTQTGTSYTLVLADAGKAVERSNSSANTVTVPPNASVAFPVGARVDVVQTGTGQTTIVAGSGVTIRSADSKLALAKQYAGASLYQRATNEWLLLGALA